MVDKDEVALSLNIHVALGDDIPHQHNNTASGHESCVPNPPVIVSKPGLDCIAQKVLQLLDLQGVACGKCTRCAYKLYPLSDDGQDEMNSILKGQFWRYRMDVLCEYGAPKYVFELTLTASHEGGLIHD